MRNSRETWRDDDEFRYHEIIYTSHSYSCSLSVLVYRLEANLLDGENEDVGLAAFHSCSATNSAKNSIGFSDKSSSWPRCLGLGMLERVHEFELLLCLKVDAYEVSWYSMIRLGVGDGE